VPGVHPLAVMRDQRGEILPKAVGEKQRGAVRSQHLGDLMHQALRHGQGAFPDVYGQDELADWVHGYLLRLALIEQPARNRAPVLAHNH
jgi:hypothetical protein